MRSLLVLVYEVRSEVPNLSSHLPPQCPRSGQGSEVPKGYIPTVTILPERRRVDPLHFVDQEKEVLRQDHVIHLCEFERHGRE